MPNETGMPNETSMANETGMPLPELAALGPAYVVRSPAGWSLNWPRRRP